MFYLKGKKQGVVKNAQKKTTKADKVAEVRVYMKLEIVTRKLNICH